MRACCRETHVSFITTLHDSLLPTVYVPADNLYIVPLLDEMRKNIQLFFAKNFFSMCSPNPQDFIRSKIDTHDDIEDIFSRNERDANKTVQQNILFAEYILNNVQEDSDLKKSMILLRRKYKVSPRYSDIIYAIKGNFYNHPKRELITKMLTSTKIRSSSGIVSITVFTPAYPVVNGKKQSFSCEYNCAFCPAEPGMPRSYLSDEPGVVRARSSNFDCVLQFIDRAATLENKGHPIDKIELLILGGTFSSYQREFQETFCRDCFYAANIYNGIHTKERQRLSIEEEQTINETADVKIIGLTIETHPTTIKKEYIRFLRMLGVTRIQMGFQHTNDAILRKIRRKCTLDQIKSAVKLLKDACFKMDSHLMQRLPDATPEIDIQMQNDMIHDPDLQVDQWKLYPCMLVPWTKIKEWYDDGSYIPYPEEDLVDVLVHAMANVTPWIRVNRVMRDISAQYIYNEGRQPMRDDVMVKLKEKGLISQDIRTREIRNEKIDPNTLKMIVRKYFASGAMEYFISFEQKGEENSADTIVAFLRLRLPKEYTLESLQGCAFVREVHVYGEAIKTSDKIKKHGQHIGLGRRLLSKAETISFFNGYKKIAVIAGIGTRNYYRKLGYIYTNEDGYLVKPIQFPFHFWAGLLTSIGIFLFFSFVRMHLSFFS